MEILLGFRLAAVDDEIAVDLELRYRLGAFYLEIGNQLAGA
jgi:hypothetical protein